ncbi:MAG: SusC/RagA family TonB-linked outer membrane protein [Chitinophagaceae bacterium]|nr:SusC/RagA family TonB-linked outer membrane protein [Chitinophagaceae bacterium]
MRFHLPWLMVFLAICGYSYSQTTPLKGKVTDQQNKPMQGVSVVVKGTRTGTTTREDGSFLLNISQSVSRPVLVFSYAGYAVREVEATGGGDVNVSLSPSSANLEDAIVVSPLGLTRKLKAVPYASQAVDPNRLTEARDVNIINGLAGKVAGIQVTSTGQPGSSSRLILRGDNSITGNSQPLWVVDGVPIANNSGELAGSGGNLDVGNGAADLNPDDIESIEVLKGPNAAALYGSKAANGAILVTTKKAKYGTDKDLGVTLNQNMMIYRITEFPAYQNVYGEGGGGNLVTNGANIIPGTGAVNMGTSTQSWGAPMLGQPFNSYSGKPLPYGYVPHPGNINDLYKNSLTNISNIAVAKSDAVSSFRASYTFTKSNDVMEKQNQGLRHNFNLYATRKLGNLLTLDFRFLYTAQDWKNRTPRNPANDATSPMAAYIYMPRSTDPSALLPYKDANGNAYRYGAQQDGYENIFWSINENRNEDTRNRYIGGVTATLRLAKFLQFRGQIAGDVLNFTQYTFRNKGGRAGANQFGSYSNDMNNQQNWYYEGLFLFNKSLGEDFSLNAVAGTSLTTFHGIDRAASIATILVPGVAAITNSNGVQTAGESNLNSRQLAVYGSANLGFRDFLFLDVTGRNEWSSTLPPGSWSFFYPSVGGSFLFSQFLTNKSILSYGKLRASWAKVGNGAGIYQLVNTYGYGGLFLNNVSLIYPTTLKNPNLKPEQVVSREVGLDLAFLKNRIQLGMTAYQTTSTNQILTAATPNETGFNSRVVNAGEMRNKGLELSLNATLMQTKDFRWSAFVNWSTNKNEVVSLTPGVTRLQLGQNLGITTNALVGQPFGILMGSSPLMYGDTIMLNGNKSGRVFQVANQVIANPRPKWIGSVGTSAQYKGFDFSVLVTAKVGGSIYCASMGRANFYGNSVASLEGRDAYFFSSFILGENDNERNGIGQTVGAAPTRYWDSTRVKGKRYAHAYFPKLGPNGQPILNKDGNPIPGDPANAWLNPQSIAADNVSNYAKLVTLDATQIRVSELVFGYTFPRAWIGGPSSFIKGARLAFVGRNLWTIHKNVPQGIDPEAALNSTAGAFGIEAGGSFPYAQFGFDLKVSF